MNSYFQQPIHFIYFGTSIEKYGGSIITKRPYECQILDEYSECNRTFFQQLKKYLEKYPTITTICYKQPTQEESQLNNDIERMKNGNTFYSKYTFIEYETLLSLLFKNEFKKNPSFPFQLYFTILEQKYSIGECDKHIAFHSNQLSNHSNEIHQKQILNPQEKYNQIQMKLSSQCHYQLNMKYIDIFQFILKNEHIPLIDSYLLEGFDYINLFSSILLFSISSFTSSKDSTNGNQIEIATNQIHFNMNQLKNIHFSIHFQK